MAVTQTQILQDMSYLLGETTIPTSVADRQTYIQRALERVYRIYDFPFFRATATVSAVLGTATLPTGVHQDGILDVREVVSGANNDNIYQPIEYRDQDSFSDGNYKYWLTGYEGAYIMQTSETTTSPILTIRYEQTAPSINASISTPFPSSMCLAWGALIYFREAEDPYADLTPYEQNFQKELNEIIADYNRSRPQPRGRTLQELQGTYMGDITTTGATSTNVGNQ